jgi:hypothetical protein
MLDDFADRVNYVTRFLADPCDAPFTVYVETAKAPLVKALLTYFAIDPKQIAIAAMRPSKGMWMWRRHPKRGTVTGGWYQSGRKAIKPLRPWLTLDPNEFLAKLLPGAQEFRGRQVTAGVASLWVFEGVIERVFNWIMIMELTSQFAYEWASAVQRTRYCQTQPLDVLLVTGGGNVVINIVEWNPMGFSDIQKERGNVSWSIFAGGINARSGFILGQCRIWNDDNVPVTYRWRLVKTNPFVEDRKSGTLQPGEELIVEGGVPFNNNTSFYMEIGAAGGTVRWDSALISASSFESLGP